jgi:hypothetical protein
MSCFEIIVELLSECKYTDLQFHADKLTKISYSKTEFVNDEIKFTKFIQNNLKKFQNVVINAYLERKTLDNLEENLNKLQIDTDFLFNFTSNWMSYLPDDIKSTKRINELLLPGTHNTCTTQILWSVKPVCLNRAQFLGSKLPLVRTKVKNLVLNQTKTIVEQVQAGVRLFDLRIATNGHNKIYIAHTYYVCELEQCLNEFKYCLNSYLNEIFVINFKIDYPCKPYFTKEDLKIVLSLFNTHLSSVILPSNHVLGTVDCLVNSGKRLIVYCNLDNHLLVDNHEFFQLNNLLRIQQSHEIWPNEERLDKVVEKLDNCLGTFNSNLEFNYFSFNTTPKFKLSSLRCSLLNRNEVKLKENFFKNFLQNACLKHISGVILDNPSFNLIQETVAFNFRK